MSGTSKTELYAAIRRDLRASLSAREIRGVEHFNFTGYALYYLAAPLNRMLALGTIDGQRGLTITAAYLNAFLDHTVD